MAEKGNKGKLRRGGKLSGKTHEMQYRQEEING